MSFAKPITGLMPPLLLLGLSAAILSFDPLDAATAVRGTLFDIYENHTPHAAPAEGRVALVTLDSGSLAHYGRWPWSNQGLSDLTRAIALAGAQAIVFTSPLDRPENDNFPAPLQSVAAVVPILLGVGASRRSPSPILNIAAAKIRSRPLPASAAAPVPCRPWRWPPRAWARPI